MREEVLMILIAAIIAISIMSYMVLMISDLLNYRYRENKNNGVDSDTFLIQKNTIQFLKVIGWMLFILAALILVSLCVVHKIY